MPDFDVYFGDDEPIDAESRAVDAWSRIQQDPKIIEIIRDGEEVDEQTVRIEFSGTGEEASSPGGRLSRQRLVVFGVKDHPTEADTDIKPRDRFAINKKQYEVITVINPPGEYQAFCEAMS